VLIPDSTPDRAVCLQVASIRKETLRHLGTLQGPSQSEIHRVPVTVQVQRVPVRVPEPRPDRRRACWMGESQRHLFHRDNLGHGHHLYAPAPRPGLRQRSTFPFADLDAGTGTWNTVANKLPASESPFRGLASMEGQTPVGASLALKLRLSDASVGAQYRLRERERERK
jgi:hypothetical protein